MATYILTFTDGRDDEEVTADWYREDPPFIEFLAFAPAEQPRIVASYRDDDVVRIERRQ